MKKIAFGTWSWGNQFLWGYSPDKDDEELRKTFFAAINHGFSLVDTADSYGTGALNGRSEYLLGKFINELNKHDRSKLLVATKLAPYPWRIGKKGLLKAFHASKNRLQNHLDIVQIHWTTARFNPWQDFQLLECLHQLQLDGNNFQIGFSNVGPQRLLKIINYLAERNVKLANVQNQFSLLSPDIGKSRRVLQICKEKKIDFYAYSPLAFGILCIPPYDNKVENYTWLRSLIKLNLLEITQELRGKIHEIALSREVSQAQVVINWCLFQDAIPIVGLRKVSHAIDISNVFNWNLTKSEFEELDDLSKNCSKKMPANPFTSN